MSEKLETIEQIKEVFEKFVDDNKLYFNNMGGYYDDGYYESFFFEYDAELKSFVFRIKNYKKLNGGIRVQCNIPKNKKDFETLLRIFLLENGG